MAPKRTPDLSIDDSVLNRANFTDIAKKTFASTIRDFSDKVFEAAVKYGEIGSGKEVTHDSVEQASKNVTRYFSIPGKSNWMVAGQIGEYVCAVTAGVAGGKLNEPWGVIGLALSITLGIVLLVARLTYSPKA